MNQVTPAQKALEYAVIGAKKYQSRRGRHSTNQLETIRSEVNKAGLGPLQNEKQLQNLRRVQKTGIDGKSWEKV